MHNWGKEGVDWKGINDAAEYIGEGLRKWGRINVSQWKEKWGIVCVYCSFGWWQVHNITHPGYSYIQWKIGHLYVPELLNKLVVPYQEWLYRRYYRKALQKWPHLREEILSGADYSELLTEHGIHRVRTSENSYDIHYDWHPDNFSARPPITKVEEGK